MTEEVLLTKEGLEKIKEEYDRHVSVTRAENKRSEKFRRPIGKCRVRCSQAGTG